MREMSKMEFIKVGKKWLIKASNGRLISDKEKKQLEKEEIKLETPHCKECEIKPKKKTKKTAPVKEVDADVIIEETDSTL
jgi:hypothetical protein